MAVTTHFPKMVLLWTTLIAKKKISKIISMEDNLSNFFYLLFMTTAMNIVKL